jgi:hypothetical protein
MGRSVPVRLDQAVAKSGGRPCSTTRTNPSPARTAWAYAEPIELALPGAGRLASSSVTSAIVASVTEWAMRIAPSSVDGTVTGSAEISVPP